MTLWDLMTAMCIAAPIGAAFSAAKLAEGGFARYLLAVTFALVAGVFCALTMRTVGNWVDAHSKRLPVQVRERQFRTLYFAAMFWIIVAGFLGAWGSSVLLRLWGKF